MTCSSQPVGKKMYYVKTHPTYKANLKIKVTVYYTVVEH